MFASLCLFLCQKFLKGHWTCCFVLKAVKPLMEAPVQLEHLLLQIAVSHLNSLRMLLQRITQELLQVVNSLPQRILSSLCLKG
eukprot:Skav209752  [mRNA]  locus=scaffold9:85255:85503:- [translate_table: standard]